jgi:formiminotetrahydrofolate cyclodeaminase
MKEDVQKLINAWESLDEGYHSPKIVANWLYEKMAPEINNLREKLKVPEVSSDKEKDKRIKTLEKALKSVAKNFPKEVLKDQMNEDYNLIEKALKTKNK